MIANAQRHGAWFTTGSKMNGQDTFLASFQTQANADAYAASLPSWAVLTNGPHPFIRGFVVEHKEVFSVTLTLKWTDAPVLEPKRQFPTFEEGFAYARKLARRLLNTNSLYAKAEEGRGNIIIVTAAVWPLHG